MNTSDLRRALVLFALMLVTGVAAARLQATRLLADTEPPLDLAAEVPKAFAGWRLVPDASAQIVDPQVTQAVDRLYAQNVSRTYVDAQGDVIMLSIAYGRDQSDGGEVHRPDYCYTTQGFAVSQVRTFDLPTPYGSIRARHMLAAKGARVEPITYWTTVGNRVGTQSLTAAVADMQYRLHGYLPDGLVFRVSTVGPAPAQAYALEQGFIAALLRAVSPAARLRLAALS